MSALSDITVFNKYAKFLKDKGRRENWNELVNRNKEMHQRMYPQIQKEIEDVYERSVHTKLVLPSMRSLQFGGRPIEMAHNRIFNCAYAPAEHYRFFSELMFLLLGGTGMGYSVQQRHVGKLPVVVGPSSRGSRTYQVQDSIIGWADAVKVTVKSFFFGQDLMKMDYRDIREKGAELITTGGLAPGPLPLQACIEGIIKVMDKAVGRHLRPVEVHDLACIIADAVLAGGIRRAAMISLFDRDDEEMLTCKSGQWWENHGYRARANNSAVLPRGVVSKEEFERIMKRVEQSGCGEPGVYWTNNLDWGTNPCCEIGLEPYQMCNLTEINAGAIYNQDDLNQAASDAAFIGTLQAGYTKFHYLNPKWRETCERGSLLGVSMTGIASGTVMTLDLGEAANEATKTNSIISDVLGIRAAERVTCVKPAGTTSLVLGTSSGVHAWHAPFYKRRMRAGKDEALAQYMQRVAPELVEQDQMVPHQLILSFPQKAPQGAIHRDENMFSLLERVKKISTEWVQGGHNKGDNCHNVSCTISVREEEWEDLTEWMWSNKEFYNGISVLPYDAGTYVQAPFEDISEEEYNQLVPHLEGIVIGDVYEESGKDVNLAGEIACAGGMCSI